LTHPRVKQVTTNKHTEREDDDNVAEIFLAKTALMLTGVALVAGAPLMATAEEEGGTKTAVSFEPNYS